MRIGEGPERLVVARARPTHQLGRWPPPCSCLPSSRRFLALTSDTDVEKGACWAVPARPVREGRDVYLGVVDPLRTGEHRLANIVISTHPLADGVVEDPDGTEGFRHGGWFRRSGGQDLEPWGKVMLGDALARRGAAAGPAHRRVVRGA